MVVQQQDDLAIWGQYTGGQKVTASASWGSEGVVTAEESGQWRLNLTTPNAGGPYQITITTKDSVITIDDVLVGEVWLASGQSNMEMPLTGYLPNEPINNYQEEIAKASYPSIRMFTVERKMSMKEETSLSGEWLICAPDHAESFSATAYFFARKLYHDLDVPIGIIHSSWGGTEAEAWTSKEGLADFPEFINEIESYNDSLISNWTSRFESSDYPYSLEDLEQLDMKDREITGPTFDNSEWATINLPHDGCRFDEFVPGAADNRLLHGVFWYRKSFSLATVDADYTLSIGAIDDADVTYVNGQKVGSTLGWQKPRSYVIPRSLLQEGENVIAIKQYDSGGGSAIVGPLNLRNAQGDQIYLEGQWTGLFYGDLTSKGILMYGLTNQHILLDRPGNLHQGPNEFASSLFNGMIEPLIPYTIKGAIWYQGESNVGRARQYESLFPAMIRDWRNQWQREFPFYFVQIAPFSYGNGLSPALRDAQRKSLSLPHTGMAITMDIGMPLSIHPGNKQDVGNRLALLALANDYDKAVESSGPAYKSHSIQGKKVIVEFDHAEGGLKFLGYESGHFEIANSDKTFVPAVATIRNSLIEVSSPVIDDPKYVRYGWRDFVNGSLFNNEGLPASSFTTEE